MSVCARGVLYLLHLLVLLVGEVVGDGVVLPDHVLDGGLPDGPGALAVGVEAAAPDLGRAAPPAAEAAPLVGVEAGVGDEDAGAAVEDEHAAPAGVGGLLHLV